ARGITTIEDLASNGHGVGHVDGKAVFVSDTLPGEQVVYQPLKVKKNHDEAELVTLLSASADRVTPQCAHFGLCGGCLLQHADAKAQLHYKQRQLLEALTRIGGVTPTEILAPLTSSAWHYRRRARLGVKHV